MTRHSFIKSPKAVRRSVHKINSSKSNESTREPKRERQIGSLRRVQTRQQQLFDGSFYRSLKRPENFEASRSSPPSKDALELVASVFVNIHVLNISACD